MNKKEFAVLAVLVLVVAVAVPLLAQTVRLTANIPFEFMVGKMTLPAGEYRINTSASLASVQIQSVEGNISALSLANRVDVKGQDPESATKLVFNRYGDKYFLSEASNGYDSVGVRLPTSHEEGELIRSAAVRTTETVTLLARR
jgi:hypothetical protein